MNLVVITVVTPPMNGQRGDDRDIDLPRYITNAQRGIQASQASVPSLRELFSEIIQLRQKSMESTVVAAISICRSLPNLSNCMTFTWESLKSPWMSTACPENTAVIRSSSERWIRTLQRPTAALLIRTLTMSKSVRVMHRLRSAGPCVMDGCATHS